MGASGEVVVFLVGEDVEDGADGEDGEEGEEAGEEEEGVVVGLEEEEEDPSAEWRASETSSGERKSWYKGTVEVRTSLACGAMVEVLSVAFY